MRPGPASLGGTTPYVFAVAVAFADASIVVLALPQVVGELDTAISHVTWMVMSKVSAG